LKGKKRRPQHGRERGKGHFRKRGEENIKGEEEPPAASPSSPEERPVDDHELRKMMPQGEEEGTCNAIEKERKKVLRCVE